MKKLGKKSITIKSIANHYFIEHLQYYEGPLVSLYRTERSNWLYIWCDTKEDQTKNRWLLINVSRNNLISYLERKTTLRNLIQDTNEHFLLDCAANGEIIESKFNVTTTSRSLYPVDNLEEISDYLPGKNSYFKLSLAENIDPEINLVPQDFSVPIAGEWFCHDFDRFTGLYSQLYAFFYCTTPQCISNLGEKIESLLLSPWEGGFSRVNLFEALKKLIPSVHDLEVRKIAFNSPGEIVFEAIPSVNSKIKDTTLRAVANYDRVVEIEKFLNKALAESGLKKRNLSSLNDSSLNLPTHFIEALKEKIKEIGSILSMEDELNELTQSSPNTVITSKVALAVLVRIKSLASFEVRGQLDFEEKQPRPYRNAINA